MKLHYQKDISATQIKQRQFVVFTSCYEPESELDKYIKTNKLDFSEESIVIKDYKDSKVVLIRDSVKPEAFKKVGLYLAEQCPKGIVALIDCIYPEETEQLCLGLIDNNNQSKATLMVEDKEQISVIASLKKAKLNISIQDRK
jgi:hypothetical protein